MAILQRVISTACLDLVQAEFVCTSAMNENTAHTMGMIAGSVLDSLHGRGSAVEVNQEPKLAPAVLLRDSCTKGNTMDV